MTTTRPEQPEASTPALQVSLFVTCLADLLRPSVAFASIKLLEQAGCEVTVPAAQTCCGQPAYNTGDYESSAPLARQLIKQFESADYVVVPSGSCAGMIHHHYPRLLDGEWREKALELAAKTFELTTFLNDIVRLRRGERPAITLPGVTYHDSCAGLRELGIKRQPRALLRELCDLEVTELPQSEVCCGFGGTFCAKMPEISGKMVNDKLTNALATEAQILAGGDLGCLLNIAGRAKRNGKAIEVRHIAELLAGDLDTPAIGQGQVVKQTSNTFLDNAHVALQDADKAQRRDIMALFTPLVRNAAMESFGHFEALRAHVKQVKQHSLEHLDHYLARFEQEALHNGNHVHFAADGEQMNSIVLEICQQHSARHVAKGKSMVTEETGLNDYLKRAGIRVMETDLGEYIIQQAGETPSHIVGPALHKSAAEVRDLFLAKHDLGDRELAETSDMVREAREVLREHFLKAEVGIIGANALIAENGYSMLVTNEGNGDLCANLPNVLIVCTTIDRVLPRAEDATATLRLLVRSATGQAQTCYTSFYSGPRREQDIDGPLETHIVLLDNRRSEILASDYKEMLQCIRCGACLNHCPIYAGVGGHAYGWVYPGPMGSILTPLLTSLEQSNALPNACTTCGRCAEVCPADIPLPDLLRDLRHEESERKLSPARWRLGLQLHAWLACHPRLYRALTGLGIFILYLLGRRKGSFKHLPLAAGWTSERDFPAPAGKTFMQQYAAQQRADKTREHKQATPVKRAPKPGRVSGRGTPVGRGSSGRTSAGRTSAGRIEPSMGEGWQHEAGPASPGTIRDSGKISGGSKDSGGKAAAKKPKAHPGGPRGKKPRRRKDHD